MATPAVIRARWKAALRANPKLQYRGDYFEESTAFRKHKLWKHGEAPGMQYTGRCCALGLLARVAGVEREVKANCEEFGLPALRKLAGLKDGHAAELIDMNDVWDCSFAEIADWLDKWYPSRTSKSSRKSSRKSTGARVLQ